jgi:hypothetical protein
MLPAQSSATEGFEEEEWPSGVVRRGPPPANYREALAGWFAGSRAGAPVLKALGTTDATPSSARIPFLIF